MNELYASLRGFTFNGKHNYKDMGVILHTKSIQPPSKKKIKETVPFMNGVYDFSTIGSKGEITFEQREITVTLGIPAVSKEQLYVFYSKILEWLVDVGPCKLVFDDIVDYYYMAEVENTGTFEEVMNLGILTVTFTADPFKVSNEYVGSDIWDTFNFEEDKIQDVEFDISGSATVQIYNPGRPVSPIINVNAPMEMREDSTNYANALVVGDNEDWGFRLQPGLNDIYIDGTGHIKFTFRKEQL